MFRWILFFFYFSIVSSFLNMKIEYDNKDYSKLSILKNSYKDFFKKPIQYEHYSNNIIFESNLSPLIKGKEKYKFFLNSLQSISKIIFYKQNIDILYTKETKDEIEILWKLEGNLKLFIPFSMKGDSYYEKDEEGFLKSHYISFHIEPDFYFYNFTDIINFNYDSLCPCSFQTKKNNTENYPHPLLKRPIRVPVNYKKIL